MLAILEETLNMFEIIFFTSNRTKTQHAQYLVRNYNVKISNFREKTYHANYDEPRTSDREKLLKESLESAKDKAISAGLSPSQPFILEDTSVIIDALSKNNLEYPGTDIKYWMRETNFETIDLQLLFSNNNRNVMVRSDLVLYLPTIPPYEFYFSSHTKGTITEKVNYNLQTNPIYPWLDNKTFNKWFCPENESTIISEMPIEVADKYDFRKGAFQDLLIFLHKNKLIINKTKTIRSQRDASFLSSLHIVVGLSCTGKTTIADYLAEKHSFLHIEASDFMHLIYLEIHGERSDVKIGEFAQRILKERPTLVAEKALDFLEKYNWSNVIITGFRKAEEVDFILDNYLTSGEIKVINITANSELRIKRKLIRNRSETTNTTENLEERDLRELGMGLEVLQKRSGILTIENNETKSIYYEKYSSQCLNSDTYNTETIEKSKIDGNKQRLYDLVIITLYRLKTDGEKSNYLTTGEICRNLNNFFILDKPKFRENIGRLLNMKFDVFFEVKYDKKNRRKTYRLSNTGVGHAKLLLKKYNL